jgi:hypothetical protein
MLLPFALLWFESRSAWRRWRFPYDRAALLAAITAVHPDPYVARRYLAGVIDGYWDSAPESQLFTRHLPSQFGSLDGGRLRRGEIVISDIPAHRQQMRDLTKTPHVKSRKVGSAHSYYSENRY